MGSGKGEEGQRPGVKAGGSPSPTRNGTPSTPGGRWGAPSVWASVCLALICCKVALAPHQHGPQWEGPYPSCCWLESRLCASGSHAPKTDNSEAVSTWAACCSPNTVCGCVEGGGCYPGRCQLTDSQSNRASNRLTCMPHLAPPPINEEEAVC